MYILSKNGLVAVNTDQCDVLSVDDVSIMMDGREKASALNARYRVSAYRGDATGTTLTMYETEERAKDALEEILYQITTGRRVCLMSEIEANIP